MGVLSEWAVSVHAFRRNKMPVRKKVLAAALCSAGYSYRKVSDLLGGISYVAARDAYFALLTSLPESEKKFRREVAIDGADVVVDGRRFYVWLARDIDSGEIMSFHASPSPSAEDSSRFLASVGALCTNKPYLRPGTGASYPRALVNADLYFQVSPAPSIIGRLGRLFLGAGN